MDVADASDDSGDEAAEYDEEARRQSLLVESLMPSSPPLIMTSPRAGQLLAEALGPASAAASKDDRDKENVCA